MTAIAPRQKDKTSIADLRSLEMPYYDYLNKTFFKICLIDSKPTRETHSKYTLKAMMEVFHLRPIKRSFMSYVKCAAKKSPNN